MAVGALDAKLFVVQQKLGEEDKVGRRKFKAGEGGEGGEGKEEVEVAAVAAVAVGKSTFRSTLS